MYTKGICSGFFFVFHVLTNLMFFIFSENFMLKKQNKEDKLSGRSGKFKISRLELKTHVPWWVKKLPLCIIVNEMFIYFHDFQLYKDPEGQVYNRLWEQITDLYMLKQVDL
jgi:hypothetical protein